ncbi:MAG: prolyl oligopeptidase family serine peptidase [Clostridia bacterium]|nr:prolyl oligopeptidase family serine peptidase [Clostridia bacterium]
MALIETHFFSKVLGMQTKMNVILPVYPGNAERKPYPVLYLLHGMSQNCNAWLHYSQIRMYAEGLGFAVVMPDASMSWYTDMKHGFAYWEHLSKELPDVVSRYFPAISRTQEDTFVAGLSMGAYGAIKFGMQQPERFCCVGAFSPPPDMEMHMYNPDFEEWEHKLYHDIFGTDEEYHASTNDLYAQAPLCAARAKNTKFYLYCGTEDVYLPQARSIAKTMQDAGYGISYEESAGSHNWAYWNGVLPQFLNKLPLKKGEK